MSNNQRITELEAKLSQLQQELDELKNLPKEWPQVGDYYWFVSAEDEPSRTVFDGCEFDSNKIAFGNMFQTREEAEAELHARLTIAKLRSQPGRKKFIPNKYNWTVEIDFSCPAITCCYWNNISGGFHSTYFESEEAVKNAIKAVGADNILKAARWLAMGETG